MDCFSSHCRYRSSSSDLLAEITEQLDRDSSERTGPDHFRAGFAATRIDYTGNTAGS
ncbi:MULTISPECIES: hypothetical protein [Rhizobium]|uniref:Uncharacterized protein n=1 Tax=Rhizobium favelukesii TaxID=348824 RepID=W6RCQ8_9HYPH|nr:MULTISPECIES: hypothetical protein [Rhizobium]MCA0803098.1 hypothetical protein [Rhizobium sp. T1473]MCS0460102.1 hypothetical protein [Rhizobium favelukesii]UFS83365.1 hypothetical protein LPB79_14065 [Rhizobium sp. T136]CDM59062.1 hypothetical protein LPU83_3418 [Rhizobium favelukesii]